MTYIGIYLLTALLCFIGYLVLAGYEKYGDVENELILRSVFCSIFWPITFICIIVISLIQLPISLGAKLRIKRQYEQSRKAERCGSNS